MSAAYLALIYSSEDMRVLGKKKASRGNRTPDLLLGNQMDPLIIQCQLHFGVAFLKRLDNIKQIKKEGKLPKKTSWLFRIIITAIFLFIILFEVAESISKSGFIETMKRPSVVGLFLIFALVSYVTSWFNIKLTAKLLLIFGLVLAVFTFLVPSVSMKFKYLMTPVIGMMIFASIVYWAFKRKK